jgi:hypothetical protein
MGTNVSEEYFGSPSGQKSKPCGQNGKNIRNRVTIKPLKTSGPNKAFLYQTTQRHISADRHDDIFGKTITTIHVA